MNFDLKLAFMNKILGKFFIDISSGATETGRKKTIQFPSFTATPFFSVIIRFFYIMWLLMYKWAPEFCFWGDVDSNILAQPVVFAVLEYIKNILI